MPDCGEPSLAATLRGAAVAAAKIVPDNFLLFDLTPVSCTHREPAVPHNDASRLIVLRSLPATGVCMTSRLAVFESVRSDFRFTDTRN